MLTTTTCCSPLDIPVVRGEVGYGYSHLFLCLLFPKPFSNYVLYKQSATSSVSYCCFRSPPTLSRPLNAVLPSHSPSSLPPFPFIFWASDLIYLGIYLPIFHLPFFPHHQLISTFSSPISSLNFPSLQPPLSAHPFFYLRSSHPRFSLSSCFHKPAPSVVSLSVSSSLGHTCHFIMQIIASTHSQAK